MLWIWMTVVFGPLGLLSYRVACRRPEDAQVTGRRALGGTLFCTSGTVAGFLVFLVPLIFVNPPFPVGPLALLLPLLVRWLMFRTPLWAYQAGEGYGTALRRILLAEIISTILVLAGATLVFNLLQGRWFPLATFRSLKRSTEAA
jgi:hypothetical protein